MISLKKILVPVDFSEPSKKAVTFGLTLAGQFNARLILAHVVPESSALVYAIPTQLLEIEREQYAKAAAEIRNLVPSEYASNVNLQTIVKIGNIEQELLGIVRDEGIDAVVMGTHWPAESGTLVHRVSDRAHAAACSRSCAHGIAP
jgi:nucleotide-binding universal stress UspA family protein